jgi:crotonobetainyl-CoA:carnitine CoA-transferase CaiB-like acyl-CoA transferase
MSQEDETSDLALHRCRVLDFSEDIAGGYLTKLLRDGGADVVKVEPPRGSMLRAWSPRHVAEHDAPLWHFLAAGTRSVQLDLSDRADLQQVRTLLSGADIVVESFAEVDAKAYGLDFPSVSHLNEAALLVSLSPFGRGTSWSGRPATEFTLQAWSGGMGARGLSDREPLSVGGRTGDWTAGIAAAAAVLAALRRARSTGRGEHLDVSEMEALSFAHTVYEVTYLSMASRPYRPQRGTHVPGIEETSDGLVGFFTLTGQQWQDFCAMIGREDWLEDDSLLIARKRLARYQELSQYVTAWTSQRTTAEIVELASAFRIPVSEIGNGESVPSLPQVAERGMVASSTSGTLEPRSPFLLDPPSRGTEPAPVLGADTDAVMTTWSSGRQSDRPGVAAESLLPFSGLRVCDLTAFWAGPVVGQFFASLGAEVIHVESIQRLDGIRLNSARSFQEPDWWEWSPLFQAVNAGKRDLTLDLSNPHGRDIAKRLIKTCDLVLENFTPRVMEHFGFTYDTLSAEHPELIMVRMPAFGITGPWRDRPGFAQTIEQASGLAWMTGYADVGPEIPVIADAIAGLHAMVAAQLALLQRDKTGRGQLVEAPMFAAALNIAAEQIVEWSANAHLERCNGNRAWYAAPQGVYECADSGAGDSGWLAVSIETDSQWADLVRALGTPDWASHSALAAASGRQERQDELDKHLADWAGQHTMEQALGSLVTAGVPAAPVMLGHFIDSLAPLRERDFFTEITNSRTGKHPFAGFPVKFSQGPESWVRCPAPTLGEDNDDLLAGLGFSGEEIEALRQDNIIGEIPIGAVKQW